MKMVCIQNTNVHNYSYGDKITVGKTYTITKEISDHATGNKYIELVNDAGRPDGYPATWFEDLNVIRNKKLEELGI